MNRKYIIVIVAVIVATVLAWLLWPKPNVPVEIVADTTPASIATAMTKLDTTTTASEVSARITEAKQSPPKTTFVTTTQTAAVKQAQEIAKDENADIVLQEKTSPVTNNFYSVHTEKRTKIKAGVTVGELNAINIGLQRDKDEVIVHRSATGYSVTYMRTIAEW